MSTILSSRDLSITVPEPLDDWRKRVIKAYREEQRDMPATMRAELASRLQILIGRTVKPEAISVDTEQREAVVVVDTVMFRLRHQDLVIVRSCTWCGGGQFESPKLTHTSDVGYALSAWQPSHPQCQAEDPVNWLETDGGAE